MKLYGYCIDCHRVRPVNITGSGVARAAAGGVPSGVCDVCRDRCPGSGRPVPARRDESRAEAEATGHCLWCGKDIARTPRGILADHERR